jgi:MFS family permease
MVRKHKSNTSFLLGLYLAFGVFHEYYTSHPTLDDSDQSAWIGVLSSGLPFLGAPGLVWLCTHWSLTRIHYIWVGFLICVAALIGAAFSPTMPTLIITQGMLFGIGILLMDNPLMIIVNTWFLKKRGIAYGILFAVCDLAGVGWSFLASYLLHLGLRKTMLIFAAIVFASAPCMLFLRERGATSIFSAGQATPTPHTPKIGSSTPKYQRYAIIPKYSTKRFFHSYMFYVLALSNLAQAFAYYLPFIYLPTFTTALGYSSGQGALILALANLAQILGEVGFGLVSDCVNVYMLVIISSTVSSVSTFLLWGFGANLGMLIAYAVVFGASGAGYIALWARMGTLFGEKDAPMVYSVMCAGRGLGSIASGPISSALLMGDVVKGNFGAGRFKYLVLFVGICLAASTTSGLVGVAVNAKPMFGKRRSQKESGTGGPAQAPET